jgi:hypothetical protein
MPDDQDDEQTTDDQSAGKSAQEQSDQEPADSDQPSAPSDDASAESDQPAEGAEEQPAENDQAADKTEEQPTAESDQPAGQSDQVAQAEGEQTDQGDGGSTATSDDTVASGGADASPAADEGSPAQPAKAGSPSVAPRKRLFRFVVGVDLRALNLVPDIKTAFQNSAGFDITDYYFDFALAGAADELIRNAGDKWERVPTDGIMDFPFSTVEKKQFFIGVVMLPNSKVDPKAPTSKPLQRIGSMHTDDFKPIKAADTPLAKKFPAGVFVLEINLLALYIQIVEAGSTTYEAELSKAKIPLEDVVYNALSPFADASGKVIGTKHDVIYWSTDLHLSGQKYVP